MFNAEENKKGEGEVGDYWRKKMNGAIDQLIENQPTNQAKTVQCAFSKVKQQKAEICIMSDIEDALHWCALGPGKSEEMKKQVKEIQYAWY